MAELVAAVAITTGRSLAISFSRVTISDAEFAAIIEAAADWHDCFPGQSFPTERKSQAKPSSHPLSKRLPLPEWAVELRKMLDAFVEFELSSRQTLPLEKLCEIGSRFGMQRLEVRVPPRLWIQLTPQAKSQLKRNLKRTIVRATRPCFELELSAFRLAAAAISSPERPLSPEIVARRVVGKVAADRLFPMFKRFPVLARLWSQLISQWCDQSVELLLRFDADRRSLSSVFFRGQSIDKIVDVRGGLSDPHNGGRTVVALRLEAGSVIYKPRKGDGEWEWRNLMEWMNAQSFRPSLRAAKVLRRERYCWMEEIRPESCKDQSAAGRFYTRVGGMICAAYLLRAVDCHRGNMIASGEYPVLIDAETLWHVDPESKTRTFLNVLFDTGFLSSSASKSSVQYRSSVLGRTRGSHTPRIGTEPVSAARYRREIVNGFQKAWHCLLGTAGRRAAFARRLRRLRRIERRWIYWSTRNYDVVRRASIQPIALRSGIERDLLIARSCARSAVSQTVVHDEINALRRFDIPYFSRKTITVQSSLPGTVTPPDLVEAIRGAVPR